MACGGPRADLDCSVCHTSSTDLVVLKCRHSFCLNCVDRVFKARETSSHSCSECGERFQTQPDEEQGKTLCNIVERLLPEQPEEKTTEILCTYCIHAPVVATRTCLLCEASLCADHLRVHAKSSQHVITEPTGSVEMWKCSIHNELLKYFCVKDKVCICTSCSLVGKHRGHKLETLVEASEKKKESLREVSEIMASKTKEIEKKVQWLKDHLSKSQMKAVDLKQWTGAVFPKVRSSMDILEMAIMSEICRQEQNASLLVSNMIGLLESESDELSRKIWHIEELLKCTVPPTILQDAETGRKNFSDLDNVTNLTAAATDKNVCGEDDLSKSYDPSLLQDIFKIIKDLMFGIYGLRPTEIKMDPVLACTCVQLSKDLKSASLIPGNVCVCPQYHGRIMSNKSLTPEINYWEVEMSGAGKIGVCYYSLSGEVYKLGEDNASWCLVTPYDHWDHKSTYLVKHDGKTTTLSNKITCPRFGICVDYEAGRISFYELGKTRVHLHTFYTTFTDALRAAFWPTAGIIKILELPSGTRKTDR